jgi:hypothetical protein
MNYYNGISKTDKVSNGGSYIKEHGTGGEIFNFSPANGYYYGYVRSVRGCQIHIEETLGGSTDDNSVNGVLVVWLAKKPQENVRIIGWYNDATVYRELQRPIKGTTRWKVDYWYNIKAKMENCVLLPVDERTFTISAAKNKDEPGFGNSNVWYAKDEKNQTLKENVIKYILDYNEIKKHFNGFVNNSVVNIDAKLLVENNAIQRVREYYERFGYTVITYEKENVGWDLEAIFEKATLHIEVKGLTSDVIMVNLTPNEYDAMISLDESYRLCIVTNARDYDSSDLNIFAYDPESGYWMDSKGLKLMIQEVTSAKISAIV